MASYEGRVEGVLVRGMLPEDIRSNPTIQDKVVAGSMARVTPGSGNVAIGARLAEALGANVGGQISLISPQGQTTPFGTVPRIVSYTVAAIFEVGVYDYDKAFVIMPIERRADAADARRCGRHGRGRDGRCRQGRRRSSRRSPSKVGRPGVVNDWRSMNAIAVRGAGGRAGGDVRRAVADHPRRGVQHPVVADHAGARQDARHRDPADDGRVAARRWCGSS